MSTTTTQVFVQEADAPSGPSVSIAQHNILQITLGGPGLMLTILAIIVGIHILQPYLTCILLVLAPLPWIIHNDYVNFLNLGPGGTPPTFRGYLKITYLRLFALSDPYTPAIFSGAIYPVQGYYERAKSWLPKRPGPRPKIAGIAPQRQIDQPGCALMNQRLRQGLKNLAMRNPHRFKIGTSCFEKKGLALFARDPINITCRGEICHIHYIDKSMHLNLHPDDARLVLEKGWGERHPLARGGWMKAFVPQQFIMVYAPRNCTELDVVCRIIEAASFWACGERFELKIEGDLLMEREAGGAGRADY
ncbi:hypothetical protein B2J93_2498 [Marssonina coronariae]|uniref:Luciferase domain-containing protein n=1 Tax=Diplocarpon coronariae TaxID=2795749 RepID=A0A218ZF88_9HELO|nr:hypothetical protein JHW43_008447 [Diplocarpon mali]OWP06260.1 hypothetical protein B2J93_2498 [Marssonina coronariae]